MAFQKLKENRLIEETKTNKSSTEQDYSREYQSNSIYYTKGIRKLGSSWRFSRISNFERVEGTDICGLLCWIDQLFDRILKIMYFQKKCKVYCFRES